MVSLFRVFYKLCKQGHWFSFENKTRGRLKKCFKEVTSSVKGWKKKFFLIERRAIPDAMPWRHIDTDVRDDFPDNVRDDFPDNYNEGDADRLAEHVILLHPPPRHLLYVCGLTTACRHPELSYSIKDPNGWGNKYDRILLSIDANLCWNGTVISKGDPIPADQRLLNRTTPPLAAGQLIPEKILAQRGVERPNAKIAEAREKKEKLARARVQLKQSGEAASITSIHQASLKPADEAVTSRPKNIAGIAATGSRTANAKNEVVNLSESTRVPTPLVNIVQPTEQAEHGDTQEDVAFSDGLRDDLRVCYFRACKEMISHLATSAEDEGLSGMSNVELEDDIGPKSKRLSDAEARIRALENEKTALVAELAQAEMDRHKVVREFNPTVVNSLGRKHEEIATMLSETSNLDIEGSKMWKDKHRKLFTKQYPYVQKVADSYRLPMADLMKVSPDIPPPTDDQVGTSAPNADGGSIGLNKEDAPPA
ncbi:hypothetical protein Tco_1344403 [Tanacetum coccineum]